MTRKHFIRMANIIREVECPNVRNHLAREFADFCREMNPNFDRARFLEACNA
jgi:hypothetical protein